VSKLAEEVASGDVRRGLVALRDLLANALDGCDSGRDIAALSARLTDVLERLAAMPAPTQGTVLDDLATRRASTGRVPATPARSRRG